MIVAGLGYRSQATAAELVRAVEHALADFRLERTDLDAIAAAPLKRDSAALEEAARLLAVRYMVPDIESIRRTEPLVRTSSIQSIRHAGTPSASEAAAIAAAGAKARLLGPRIVVSGVTCAIAIGGEPS